MEGTEPASLRAARPGPATTSIGGSQRASVVIVNFNGRQFIGACLEAVLGQSLKPFEIIVVDNASADGSAGFIESRFPEVRLVCSRSNLGFTGGCNVGTALATGRWIVLLNPDARPRRDWLAPLVEEALRSPPGELVRSLVVTKGVALATYELEERLNVVGNLARCEGSCGNFAFAAAGGAMCFEKRFYPVPFPPEYFLYHEDVFMSWRACLLGRGVRLVRGSLVEHLGSASTSRFPRFVAFHQEKNRIANCLVFFEDRTLFLLAPLLVADALLNLVRRPLSVTRAGLWIVGNRSKVRGWRREIQSLRTVPDRHIMNGVTAQILPHRSGAARRLNGLVARYCRAVDLPVWETPSLERGS